MRRATLFAFVTTTSSLAFAADPKTECIAAADQAQQARDDGKWRAARDGFVSCSRSVCPKIIAASCTKWGRELEEGMPTVVLSAKDASGADVADVRVTFDGAPLATTLDGKPVDVDPGSHKIRFERDGSQPAEQSVVIKAGEKLRPVAVVLRPTTAAVVVSTTPVEPIHEKSGAGDGSHVATTIVLGIVAAGALAGGVGLGFASQSDADTAAALRAAMPSSACASTGTSVSCQSLSNAVDAQNRDAAISVAMYVGSGLFAAAAVVAWIAWPKAKAESAAARVFVGPGVVGFGGVF